MEKKKLLLVAISVGVFLVLTISAAILVFTPKNVTLPFETISNTSNPDTTPLVPSSYQPLAIGSEQQPSSIDAVDLVRNPGGVPGLVTPPEGMNSPVNGTGSDTESVISVTQPTTAAVPNTAPAGRAANQSTTATTTRPAQTTTTPAQTSTSTTQTATTPAQTSTNTTQTTSRPAQTTASPSQTATTAAQTSTNTTQIVTTPAQTNTNASQTASTPAQTTTTQTQAAQTTSAALTETQAIPASLSKAYDDYWVQTGAFSTIVSAEAVKETLASKGITSIIENANVNGRNLFRVRVGPYTTQNEANYWLALIKSMDGFEDSQVRQSPNLR